MNFVEIIKNNNGIEFELTEAGRQSLLESETLFIQGNDGIGCELDNLEFTSRLFDDTPIHVLESSDNELYLIDEDQQLYTHHGERYIKGLVYYGKAFFRRLTS